MTTIVRHSAEGLSYLSCDGGGDVPLVLLHGIGSNAHSFEPTGTSPAICAPAQSVPLSASKRMRLFV